MCETWTGSDYQMYARDASGAPVSETGPDLKSVEYQAGQATGYANDGTNVADPTAVGADAFAFGQATPEEKQASYDDPYYAVYQEPTGSCGEMVACSTLRVTRSVDGRPLPSASQPNPDAARVGRKEHGFKRASLRALLGNKDEIERAPNGNRRFRFVQGDEESVIEVDPKNELMVAQEARSGAMRTRTRLFWTRRGNRFVRERMEVDATTDPSGATTTTRAVIELSDLRVGGAL